MTNRYAVLQRQWCRKFGQNPVQADISKNELLTESAFRELELQGAFQPERFDFVISAIAWLLEMILVSHGFRFEELDDELLENGLKFRKRPAKTPEQIVQQKNNTNDKFFLALKTMMDAFNHDKH